RRFRRHAGERLELQRRDLDAALGELTARVEPVDLDHLQALLQRWGRARSYAALHEREPVPIDLQQVIDHPQAPLRRQDLAGLHANVGAQTALAIGDLPAPGVQLAFRHTHAARLATVEVERQRQADVQIVVRADRLLSPQLERGVWPESRLLHPGRRRLHLDPRRHEVGVLRQRPADELVHRQLARRLTNGEPGLERGEADRQERYYRHGASHRHAYRTETENFVEPLPAGPSQVTVTCRVPLSGNVIVPR